jgi:hypothetical protein
MAMPARPTLLIAVAAAVAAGQDALGELQVQPGPVLYVTGEDDEAFMRNRAEAIAAGHGWDRTRMLGNFHVFAEGADLDDPRWQAHLRDVARDLWTPRLPMWLSSRRTCPGRSSICTTTMQRSCAPTTCI